MVGAVTAQLLLARVHDRALIGLGVMVERRAIQP